MPYACKPKHSFYVWKDSNSQEYRQTCKSSFFIFTFILPPIFYQALESFAIFAFPTFGIIAAKAVNMWI